MFPDLIDLGFLHLKTYGACMAVGFILCWGLIERLSGRKDLSNLLMALMVGGVAGSRIAYVIEHWQAEFAAHPMRPQACPSGMTAASRSASFSGFSRLKKHQAKKMANDRMNPP